MTQPTTEYISDMSRSLRMDKDDPDYYEIRRKARIASTFINAQLLAAQEMAKAFSLLMPVALEQMPDHLICSGILDDARKALKAWAEAGGE